jgi:hypothetical protein
MARHAAEWGLASLLCSGILSLGATIILVLSAQLAMGARRTMDKTGLMLTTIGAVVCILLVFVLIGLCVMASIKSLLSARSRNQPAAFGVMGLVASMLALALWLLSAATLFVVLAT